jgi:hypothetical protein
LETAVPSISKAPASADTHENVESGMGRLIKLHPVPIADGKGIA